MPHLPLLVPETKPATEFVDGQFVQKVSPFGLHARVQLALASALRSWAMEGGRGRVGTEWDYDLTPPGGRTNRLVPDAAYLSYKRVGFGDKSSAQVPVVAPNVAVEMLSHGQTQGNSQRRIDIYLSTGAELVILVDPRSEEARLIDSDGVRHLEGDAVIEHPALPEFSMPLRECFEEAPPRGDSI